MTTYRRAKPRPDPPAPTPEENARMVRELRLLVATMMRPHHYLTEREVAVHLGLDEAQLHDRAVRHAAAGVMLLMGEA